MVSVDFIHSGGKVVLVVCSYTGKKGKKEGGEGLGILDSWRTDVKDIFATGFFVLGSIARSDLLTS